MKRKKAPRYAAKLLKKMTRRLAENDVTRIEGAVPGLYHVRVSHDDWCKRPDGGPCTCDPDVGDAIPNDEWNQ